MHSASTIARLGLHELAARAKRGELTIGSLWMGAKGAEAYVAAIARGDIATPEQADARWAQGCAICPSRTVTPCSVTIDGGLVVTAKHWCGPALTERPTTCGCLLALTIDGVPVPAAKLCVRSERCPAGRW